MDKDSPIAHGREEEQRQEQSRLPDEPPLNLLEPEEMGGEPPCYAHLLDEEGNLEGCTRSGLRHLSNLSRQKNTSNNPPSDGCAPARLCRMLLP